MLGLEDLLVANLVARQELMGGEALAGLMQELDKLPARGSLIRTLHERGILSIQQARGIHDAARRRARRIYEDIYAGLLRAHHLLPEGVLEALLQELTIDGNAWSIGERLVQRGQLDPGRHEALARDAAWRFGDHEGRLLEQNRQQGFRQATGASGRLATSSDVIRAGAEAHSGAARGWAPPVAAPGGVGPSPFESQNLSRSAAHYGAPPQGSDGERTVELANPQDPFSAPAAPDVTVKFGPGAVAAASAPPLDPNRTMQFSATLPTPPQGGGFGDAGGERTIDLPAGAVAEAYADPFRTVVGVGGGPPPSDATVTLSAQDVAEANRSAMGSVGGKYEIVRELGRGNMGIVFLARDAQRGAFVAVKVVKGPANDEVRGRFQREILVGKRLRHEHVIEVFDEGDLPDGSSYMVMEYLEGESLRDLIRRGGPLPVPQALELLDQLARGLAAVHASGIVHRDLKPENVQVIKREGDLFLKLMDFGISRFLDQQETNPEVFMTMKGTLSGTPAYVAPEAVLDPEDVRPSHDVYAAGVLFYELLTAQTPFSAARTLKDILTDTLHARPRPLEDAYPAGAPYPPVAAALIAKLLEKDPTLRPVDGSQLLEAVAEAQQELAGGARPKAAPRKRKRAEQESEGITARFLRKITGIFRRGSSED